MVGWDLRLLTQAFTIERMRFFFDLSSKSENERDIETVREMVPPWFHSVLCEELASQLGSPLTFEEIVLHTYGGVLAVVHRKTSSSLS